MKLRWDNQHVRWGVTSFLVIAASMLFYYGVFHMKTLITGIQTFLGILTPIVYGVVIAFLLTPVLNFLEKKIIYPALARKEVSVGKEGAQGNSVGMRNFMYVSLPCSYLCPYYDDSARTDPKYYGSDLQFSSLCEGYSEMAAVFH
mgnify:CR=1 FL=1